MWVGHLGFSQFYQMSRQHIILSLNFGLTQHFLRAVAKFTNSINNLLSSYNVPGAVPGSGHAAVVGGRGRALSYNLGTVNIQNVNYLV